MSFLRVAVDGQPIASISTDGLEVVSVHVGGSRLDCEYADLNVSGGVYPEDGESDHRIWVDQMRLIAGQVVDVALLERDKAVGDGRTIGELYPASESVPVPTPIDKAEFFADLRRQPQLREGFTVRLTSSVGTTGMFSTASDDHGFGFSVLWNNMRPERVSVSLHAYSIDSMESGESGRDFVRERLPLGGTVRLELVA
jgi:hypothetical protein